MPAAEQVAPEPASRSRLQPAAGWSVAALITLAAAISVLLSKTVARGAASATPARATAKPSQHHPGPQPRRARARAHAHRVMTAHAVQVAARARRTRGITISSSFRGNYWWCAGSCAPGMAAVRRDWQLQRYQVRVRGHPGQTPAPAAQPGRRAVPAPQACVPARRTAAGSHGWPPGDGQPVHPAQIPLPRRLRAMTVPGSHSRLRAGGRLAVRRSRCRRRRITSMRRRFLTPP